MNIKEHIEAGHYPKDEKGRALVPVGCDCVATICATDAPGSKPLLGFIASVGNTTPWCMWDEHGNNTPSQPRACWVDLLPPPSRKVTEVRWAAFNRHGRWVNSASSRTALVDDEGSDAFLAEVTCTYELPWGCESTEA